MSDWAIRIEDVSKKFQIGTAELSATTFVEALGSVFSSPWKRLKSGSLASAGLREFWALREVSFDVREGDVVGIIGHNGAGKSTLLKILSRITEPTSGCVRIRGRVASLLEVGTGFHPELTGRENIFLNGSILGMTRREIQQKFDAIVEFSGVEQFLDTPFKRYSSGMGVRLAFAVAAHLDPEILIIDEVLAVGDAQFQKKCLGKMSEVAGSGRTVLFVSHNMAAVQNLCQRAILLDHGRIAGDGESESVIDQYLDQLHEQVAIGAALPAIRGVTAKVEVRGVNDDYCRPNEPMTFRIQVDSDRPVGNLHVAFGIDDHHGHRLSTIGTYFQTTRLIELNEQAVFTARWDRVNLVPGMYWLTIAVFDGPLMHAHWERAISFTVATSDYYGTGRLPHPGSQGCILTPVSWTVETDRSEGFEIASPAGSA